MAVFILRASFTVGANIREANQEVAVPGIAHACLLSALALHGMCVQAEAGQNGGKSDFQAAYAQTLTAKEMGAHS